MEVLDISNPKDKRIYEEFKKLSGHELSTIQFVNYKQFNRTDKELDFLELLPRLHFGLALFFDHGQEAKVVRFSKFITMLGITILIISSCKFEGDQFKGTDLNRAVLQVALGIIAL